jgi:hypothetical protein
MFKQLSGERNLNMVDIHHQVFTSGQLNFACCKIIIETKFNFDLREKLLVEYNDNIIEQLMIQIHHV